MTQPPSAGRRATVGSVAVVLPGAGSDHVFVEAAFAGPLAAAGIELRSPRLRAAALPERGYLDALDAAVESTSRRPLLVGGISWGAHLAAEWACQRAGLDLAGLLVALPGWVADPSAAPASLAATTTASAIRAGGLAAAIADMQSGAPGWLAAELTRSWRCHGDGLAAALEAAASRPGPGLPALRGLHVPAGIVGMADDPVHPIEVARAWAAALPCSVLTTGRLAELGRDPAVLGRAAVRGWLRARSAPEPVRR